MVLKTTLYSCLVCALRLLNPFLTGNLHTNISYMTDKKFLILKFEKLAIIFIYINIKRALELPLDPPLGLLARPDHHYF